MPDVVALEDSPAEFEPGLTFDLYKWEISINTSGRHRFTLYGLGGQVVRTEQGNNRAVYNISGLLPGIYLVQIFNQGKIHRRKLVIF